MSISLFFWRKAPTITVYIHSTRVLPHMLIKKLFHCTDGFHSAAEIDQWYQQRQAVDWISSTGQKEFPSDSFYIFCWSGMLLPGSREKAAHKLYGYLSDLVAQYKKQYGAIPKIKIVAHSHGANVALNLAQQFKGKPNFVVDDLILLACPVQKRTAHLIESPIFKCVYSLYSLKDMVQWLDPQLLQTLDQRALFSERVFPLHKNLKQAAITIEGTGISHFDFLWEKFNLLLPVFMKEMKTLSHPGSSSDAHHVIDMSDK